MRRSNRILIKTTISRKHVEPQLHHKFVRESNTRFKRGIRMRKQQLNTYAGERTPFPTMPSASE